MNTATAAPEVRAHTETAQQHREHVKSAMRRAHAEEDYAALDRLIDGAPPQAKAMALTCLTLSIANSAAGDHVRHRLQEQVSDIAEQIGQATGEPDDLAAQWLSLLAGIEHGYRQQGEL